MRKRQAIYVQGAEEHGVDKRKQIWFFDFFVSCACTKGLHCCAALQSNLRRQQICCGCYVPPVPAGSQNCVIRIRCARWIYSFHMMAKPFNCYLWIWIYHPLCAFKMQTLRIRYLKAPKCIYEHCDSATHLWNAWFVVKQTWYQIWQIFRTDDLIMVMWSNCLNWMLISNKMSAQQLKEASSGNPGRPIQSRICWTRKLSNSYSLIRSAVSFGGKPIVLGAWRLLGISHRKTNKIFPFTLVVWQR